MQGPQGNHSGTNYQSKGQVKVLDCSEDGEISKTVQYLRLTYQMVEQKRLPQAKMLGNRPRTISGGLQRRLSNAQGPCVQYENNCAWSSRNG